LATESEVQVFNERQIIENAIRDRAVIEFGYDGFRRVFWPYVLGETKTGEVEVFGWQQRSGKGGAPDFRQFRLDRLTGVLVTGASFERPRQPIDPADRGFVRVIIRVSSQ
jgi:predicted DNA-binding transcriptional regulator YafY